jgi:RNA polymerase primary sigma factor
MNELRPKSRPGMAAYYLEIHRFPLLSPDRELDVATRLRREEREEDLHHLVQSNLRFVVRIARQYVGGALPLEDLVSEGNLGLLRAARRFDPARGNRFLSCAVWWIRKAILDALENRGALVRVPRHEVRKVRQARALGAELSTRLGRRAEREEVSRALGVGLRDLEETEGRVQKMVSLDAPAVKDGKSLLRDLIPDRRAATPEQALFRQEDRARLRRAIRCLNSREYQVLSERFGLGSHGSSTLKEVGQRLGISREMVRQIEVRARGKLLRVLSRDGAYPRAATFSTSSTRRMA